MKEFHLDCSVGSLSIYSICHLQRLPQGMHAIAEGQCLGDLIDLITLNFLNFFLWTPGGFGYTKPTFNYLLVMKHFTCSDTRRQITESSYMNNGVFVRQPVTFNETHVHSFAGLSFKHYI